MKDLPTLLKSVTPEVYDSLVKAVELGKWADGGALSDQQRKDSLQIIIAYDMLHKPENERVGFVESGNRSLLKQDTPPKNSEQTLTIK